MYKQVKQSITCLSRKVMKCGFLSNEQYITFSKSLHGIAGKNTTTRVVPFLELLSYFSSGLKATNLLFSDLFLLQRFFFNFLSQDELNNELTNNVLQLKMIITIINHDK